MLIIELICILAEFQRDVRDLPSHVQLNYVLYVLINEREWAATWSPILSRDTAELAIIYPEMLPVWDRRKDTVAN